MDIPSDRSYTEDDLWALPDGDEVVLGITDFAQDQLGQIVYVDLPAVGADVAPGEPFGEIESTKTVADLIAPVTGDIVALNQALDASPELINDTPYGDGWLVRVRLDNGSGIDDLLDHDAYRSLRGS